MEELFSICVPPPRDSSRIRGVHVSPAPWKDPFPGIECPSSSNTGCDQRYADATKLGACSLGVKPETPVLMADLTWRPASRLRHGDWVLGFDEKPDPGRNRRYRVATVEALTIRKARTITLSTAFGEVTCTPDHRWLEKNRFRSAATIGELRLATVPVPPPAFGAGYKMGYLRGAMAGDGAFTHGPTRTRALLRVCDATFAARFARFGRDLGFDGFREFTYSAGYTMRPLYGIRTSRVKEVSRLGPYSEPRPTTEYMRGWLAGAFDAEGSNGGGSMLRIHQRISNRPFWKTAKHFLETLDVPYADEERRPSESDGGERMGSLRIGRVASQLRFIALTQPVVERKWAHLRRGRLKGAAQAAPVLSRRDAGVRAVINIQTSTGTLVEGGFFSHNRRVVPIPGRKQMQHEEVMCLVNVPWPRNRPGPPGNPMERLHATAGRVGLRVSQSGDHADARDRRASRKPCGRSFADLPR